jgi:hypothetical protein
MRPRNSNLKSSSEETLSDFNLPIIYYYIPQKKSEPALRPARLSIVAKKEKTRRNRQAFSTFPIKC